LDGKERRRLFEEAMLPPRAACTTSCANIKTLARKIPLKSQGCWETKTSKFVCPPKRPESKKRAHRPSKVPRTHCAEKAGAMNAKSDIHTKRLDQMRSREGQQEAHGLLVEQLDTSWQKHFPSLGPLKEAAKASLAEEDLSDSQCIARKANHARHKDVALVATLDVEASDTFDTVESQFQDLERKGEEAVVLPEFGAGGEKLDQFASSFIVLEEGGMDPGSDEMDAAVHDAAAGVEQIVQQQAAKSSNVAAQVKDKEAGAPSVEIKKKTGGNGNVGFTLWVGPGSSGERGMQHQGRAGKAQRNVDVSPIGDEEFAALIDARKKAAEPLVSPVSDDEFAAFIDARRKEFGSSAWA